MARITQLPERPDWLQDVNSMLVSAVCHLAILIALGLLAVSSHGPRGRELQLSLGGGPQGVDSPVLDDTPLDDTSLGDAVNLDDSVNAAAAFEPVNQIDVSAPALGPVNPIDVSAPAELSALSSFSGHSSDVGGLSGVSGLSGVAHGGGRGGDGSATKAATEFFGIGGYGQSFVYVVDCSSSMRDHGKFERARYELLQSIEQLAGDQRFFVIFYNDGAYPMDADKPVLATQDQIAHTTQWINQVEPDGGTNPLPALLLALSLRPDAIYFLSDGQFDPATIQQLRSRNRANRRLDMRQIPIHTIAFFDRFAEGLMRTIARNSGGEYRFVK